MYQIIIADDEVIERTALHRKLDKYCGDSVTIREAGNGREVLELYGQQAADILILDIEMPGVTGLEAAEELRHQGEACSLIFLTAFDEFSYARKAISVHATDYLLKPCDDRELVAAVEEGMRAAEDRRNRGKDGTTAAAETPVNASVAAPAGAASHTDTQQEKIGAIITRQYMTDLSVADMADALGYSEAYFCKLFKQYFGQSFVSYLTEYRIREAMRLLASEKVGIKEVGQSVGYADSNYFAKVFKRVTGQSPSEYRAGNVHNG